MVRYMYPRNMAKRYAFTIINILYFFACGHPLVVPTNVVRFPYSDMVRMLHWLAVWKSLEHFWFFHILGIINHPNWLSYISQTLKPSTSTCWSCLLEAMDRCGPSLQDPIGYPDIAGVVPLQQSNDFVYMDTSMYAYITYTHSDVYIIILYIYIYRCRYMNS